VCALLKTTSEPRTDDDPRRSDYHIRFGFVLR